MKKTILAFLLLAACGGQPSDVADGPSESTDMASQSDQGQEQLDPSGGTGGNLSPGFNQRGCQWDNPACGPTPGPLVYQPQPDDR